MSTPPRVAFITGGAQGIGEAIAVRLAQEGLDVAILDVKGKEQLLEGVADKVKDAGRRAVWLTGDVTREEEVKQAVEKVVETLRGLDEMVANAGVIKWGPLVNMELNQWNKIMAVNATGVMLCYKHAAIQMIKQGRGGRIIGAASAAAKRGQADFSAYCASKFAVRGLTQAAALELRQHKITVNAYAPGSVLTPMVLRFGDDEYAGPEALSGSKILAETVEASGAAEPEVIAGLVSYLVKPESWFVTGQSIDINGGLYMS